jgi:hypothetical protein
MVFKTAMCFQLIWITPAACRLFSFKPWPSYVQRNISRDTAKSAWQALTAWHKIISAPATLVLELERMTVSPCSLEGGGVRNLPPQTSLHWSINSDQTVSIREAMDSNLGLESGHLDWHLKLYGGENKATKVSGQMVAQLHIWLTSVLGASQRSVSFHGLAASWSSGQDMRLLPPPRTEPWFLGQPIRGLAITQVTAVSFSIFPH